MYLLKKFIGRYILFHEITSISIAYQSLDIRFNPDTRIIMPIATANQSNIVLVAFNHPGIKNRSRKI